MKFADLISDVFLNLTRKKMRTTLTMVGVVIGAVAVVTTTAAPASVTRQQSRRWKGHDIQRELW